MPQRIQRQRREGWRLPTNMEKQVLVGALIAGMGIALFTVNLIPAIAWDGAQDNKQIAELQLMSDDELILEIMSVCTKVAVTKKKANQLASEFPQPELAGRILDEKSQALNLAVQGGEYANRIERVWRSKQGETYAPPWMSRLKVGISSADLPKCQAAFDEYLQTIKGTKPKRPGRK